MFEHLFPWYLGWTLHVLTIKMCWILCLYKWWAGETFKEVDGLNFLWDLAGSVLRLTSFWFFLLSFTNLLIVMPCWSPSWRGTSRFLCHFPVLLPGCCLPSPSQKQEGEAAECQRCPIYCFHDFLGHTHLSSSLESLHYSSGGSFMRHRTIDSLHSELI